MRLWHEELVPVLPRPQLLGQHRECCALRGNAWLKPHSIINYIFDYEPYRLYLYHVLIMDEMKRRGYNVEPLWYDPYYRGKVAQPWAEQELKMDKDIVYPFYKEHDECYLNECLENLRQKGIILDVNNSKENNT